jgi:hypothetical protein
VVGGGNRRGQLGHQEQGQHARRQGGYCPQYPVHRTSKPPGIINICKENYPVNVTSLPGNAIAKMGSSVYLTGVNGGLMRKAKAFSLK